MFGDVVPVRDALAVEVVAGSALLFAAFGVGLDPRQRKVIPPSLAPFLELLMILYGMLACLLAREKMNRTPRFCEL